MDKVDRIKEQWAMYAERWKSFFFWPHGKRDLP